MSPLEFAVQVGLRIRRRRREMGLTQAELGEAAGVGFRQVHKYETGESAMPLHRLAAIAAALKTAPGWFFEGLGV